MACIFSFFHLYGWFSLIFVRIVLFLYGKFERHLGATIFAKQIITRDNPTMVIDE